MKKIIVLVTLLLIFGCNKSRSNDDQNNHNDSTIVRVVNQPIIADTIMSDTSFVFTDLLDFAMQASYNIDFEAIDKTIVKSAKKTGFDFGLFTEQPIKGDVVYSVHRDTTGNINMIEQVPTVHGYLKCDYYVYRSKKNSRFSFLFAKELREDGSDTHLGGCIVRDGLMNKLMYLCWNKPTSHNITNLASVMMLDCHTLDVKSYVRLVSGGIKYLARIDYQASGVYKKCYFQNTPSFGQLEMTKLYDILESPVQDSLFYLSVPLKTFEGQSDYPLWYRNAYFLIVGDSEHFPARKE